MLGWLFGKSLDQALTKTVRVHGVKFKIRKINPLDYLSGSKAVRQVFETHRVDTRSKVELTGNQANDIKSHFSDVFLATVLQPALKRSPDIPGDGIPVEHLMTDWDLANELYERIIEFTYGKKKLRRLAYQKTVVSSSTP